MPDATHIPIVDLLKKKQFTEISEIYRISAVISGTQKNGDPYWFLTLSDITGKITAKIWSGSQASRYADTLKANQYIQVQASVSVYQNSRELTVSDFQTVPDTKVDPTLFLLSSERPPLDMLKELEQICTRTLTFSGWKNLVFSILHDQNIRAGLLRSPAAKAMHHAYIGGLIEHTLAVAQLCMRFCDLYPRLDRQILLAGAVCHDIGKIREYPDGAGSDISAEGELIGHITIGLEMLEPFLRQSDLNEMQKMHLRHMIASHHGKLEFGSPKTPRTEEALALHYADDLDAKMAGCRSVFTDFSEPEMDDHPLRIDRPHPNILGSSILRFGKTLEQIDLKNDKKILKKGVTQCSLLSKA
ncbi:MAG: HD domain-containing protein [Desulfovibrionaceae bacterium]|nr:HD domain-containing protein [Desulfovibrionaceae bacterium]